MSNMFASVVVLPSVVAFSRGGRPKPRDADALHPLSLLREAESDERTAVPPRSAMNCVVACALVRNYTAQKTTRLHAGRHVGVVWRVDIEHRTCGRGGAKSSISARPRRIGSATLDVASTVR